MQVAACVMENMGAYCSNFFVLLVLSILITSRFSNVIEIGTKNLLGYIIFQNQAKLQAVHIFQVLE